jgi:hypothetical protein
MVFISSFKCFQRAQVEELDGHGGPYSRCFFRAD